MQSLRAVAVLFAAVAGLGASASPAAPAPDVDAERANRAVREALSSAGEPIEQARSLVKLAWPDGKRDEVIAARARRELVDFGGHGMVALSEAINTANAAYAAEIVRTIISAGGATRAGNAPEHIPALIDALWVNNHEARELAIASLVPRRPALAVQAMIDAAIEDPTLAPQVVAALGAMRYEQARFYLETVMMEGPAALRPVAASSLSQIGGAALTPLKNALKAPSRDARLLAARAILPAATDRELGALYEYVRDHGDDDPALTEALKASAVNIEKAIAARDAAAAPKDF